MVFCACTVDGDPVAIDPVSLSGLSSSSDASSSSSAPADSLSSGAEPSDSLSSSAEPSDSLSSSAEPTSSAGGGDVERDSSVYKMLDFVAISRGKVKINAIEFAFDSYAISAIEVTQAAYKGAMGKLPKQSRQGDDYPVVNVSWYDAVLFCNALSKMLGLDTAYVYASVGEKNYLQNLEIDYSKASVRLPTEIEWEVAAHGGASGTYYWGTDKATKYAYYGQSSGPAEVKGYTPNEYGLYDMAGNAAEWVNDWYDAYPKKNSENYTGASQGTARVVRGGGWSDPIKDCAPDVREKKDPLYASDALGFRVVLTAGF
ncbi:MAG: SUMF1/EgtB/PvdO family nonheme iron enzyme [Fibrobacter sp.]|nr:SUMF1/EgtB/PvdO family nonheme iron enzyme [Fibrobacter sp.]